MSGKTNFSVLLAMCVFLLGIGTTSFAGQIFHVDSSIGDDVLTNDTAFATIQKGVEEAAGEFIGPGRESSVRWQQGKLGMLWLVRLVQGKL